MKEICMLTVEKPRLGINLEERVVGFGAERENEP